MHRINFSELSDEEKYSHLEDFKSSGLNRAQYCREKGICSAKFEYWGSKFGYFEGKKSGFKKVSSSELSIKIELEHNIALRLSVNSYSELKQLLMALNSNV